MNVIRLDGRVLEKCSHEYLIKKLDLPDYYGKNLDALYDCLTSIGMKTEIQIDNSKFIQKEMLDTFADSADVNDFLTIKIIS